MKFNFHYLQQSNLEEELVLLPMAVEADEQWSFVQSKRNQRWLWCVLGHRTHEVIAYAFGSRTHAVLSRLLTLLSPLKMTHWFTDGLKTYHELLDQTKHFTGKRNTQKIERFFLTLRTRIKRLTRRTICFSKSIIMHDTVIALFINRYYFGQNV